jgi:hypothetical protein
MNKVTSSIILAATLIAVIGVQHANAQLGIDIGNAANRNSNSNGATIKDFFGKNYFANSNGNVDTQLGKGAHITISNVHMVTTHKGLIGPSHYEVQGTMTNDGTEPSSTVMLRMYIERNGGEATAVKTFLASNTLYPGQSEDFGIPFTSDEVNAYHPDATGKVVYIGICKHMTSSSAPPPSPSSLC